MSESKEQRKARLKAERDKRDARLAAVEDAMVLGLRPKQIESKLAPLYGVSGRMIRKDMEKIRDQWAEVAMKDEKRDVKLYRFEQKVKGFYQRCIAGNYMGAAARALVLEADLLGARKLQVEHSGSVDHGIKDMTSDDKRRRLEELMEIARKRAEAKAKREDGKPN